jgi:hypothetical protein
MDIGLSKIQSAMRAFGGPLAVALICAGAPVAATAQDGPLDMRLELRPSIDSAEPEPMLSPEDAAIIDQALAVDAASFASAPAKPLRLPALRANKDLDLSRTDRPDGSGTFTVKKPLAAEWGANIGADLGLAADAPQGYGPDNPLGVTRNDRGSGAAWATLGVTNFATVDARVDPNNEQGRIATTFKHSLPIGDKFSVSMQSRTSVTETFGQPQAATSDIPLRAAPVGDPAAPVPRVWGHENVAKLDILQTGTTLGAGLSSNSTDPLTHNTLSAEQKIYGPLGIATTVTDIGRASESKSLSARLKLSW